MKRLIFAIISLFTLMGYTSCSDFMNDDNLHMLLGSYGPADKEGVFLYGFDQSTGEATKFRALSGIADPSFLAIDPDHQHFFAVSEEDDSTAALVCCEIVGDSMRIVNRQLTGGEAPCYVNLFRNFAFTANYNGSSFTTFPIIPETRILLPRRTVTKFEGNGPVADRQEKSHIHCVEFTPDSTFMLIDDLGADKTYMYPTAKITQITNIQPQVVNYEPGTGPRHITFDAEGKHAYVIGELSGKVVVMDYNGKTLTPKQYAVCDSVGAQGSADIHLSPDGKFLYASNRLKADGIAIFKVDKESGKIEKVGYQLTGIHPRNFAITPNGKYLLCACRDSNVIQVYERDEDTGLLTDTKKDIKMSKPVCIKFF